MRRAAALLALVAACGGGAAEKTDEPAASQEKLPPGDPEPVDPDLDVGLPQDPPLDADGLPPKTVKLADLEPYRLSGDLEGIAAGSFVAKLCIDATGAPSALKLLKSSGERARDRSVLERLTAWRFKPFLVETVPVAVCTVFTVLRREP